MSLVAGDLVTIGKQRAYGGVGHQKISTMLLLTELGYQDLLVVQMISQTAPDLLATVTGATTLTDAGNLNGYALASGLHYRDFTHVDPATDTYTPISIIMRRGEQTHHAAPAAMINTGANAALLYPVDPLGKRWQGSSARSWFNPNLNHTIAYSYVPIPGNITSLSDTLVSPDMAREVMTTALELRVLLANPNPNQLKIEMAAASYTRAFEALRWQVQKFVNLSPIGTSQTLESESAWVDNQVSG